MSPWEERLINSDADHGFSYIKGDLLRRIYIDGCTYYVIGRDDGTFVLLALTEFLAAPGVPKVKVPLPSSIPVNFEENPDLGDIPVLPYETVQLKMYAFRVGSIILDVVAGFSKTVRRWYQRTD